MPDPCRYDRDIPAFKPYFTEFGIQFNLTAIAAEQLGKRMCMQILFDHTRKLAVVIAPVIRVDDHAKREIVYIHAALMLIW